MEEIDAAFTGILERHATAEEAQRSRAWNHRKREPCPADYEETLARHATWKAEQTNALVRARLDRAVEESGRVADRLSSNPDYLKGFAAGLEAMKSIRPEGCSELLAGDFASLPAARGGAMHASGARGANSTLTPQTCRRTCSSLRGSGVPRPSRSRSRVGR